MTLHCMAEAQSITVLRAVKKGNQPGLIASLALDTANLYRCVVVVVIVVVVVVVVVFIVVQWE